ncbi:Glypican-1 [Stylophora pistillata]|uniref:Glypican-1 n=1 Tax=Stylophora pistillata TaxID=50429 RepID=A0A2B4SDA6_STYPI|nr:Glypican-1 [Stylophora pistillata]
MVSFYVFLVVLATVSSGFGQDNDNEPSCASVKTAYRQKRLTDSDVPQWAVRGDDLRVCPKDNGKQCCSQQMEDRFAVLASDDFDKAVSSKVSELKRQFHLQEKAFDVSELLWSLHEPLYRVVAKCQLLVNTLDFWGSDHWVFQTCGKPDLTKRSTDDFFLEGNSRQRRESDAALPRKSSDVTLESLKADFKTKMKMADNYWTFLPEMLCSDIAGDKDEPSQCWNGTGKGSYSHPVDGRNAVEENPTPSVVKAIEKLKSIEKMIEEYSNAAVYGDDINIITTDDEDDEDESGSGSGDGSGGSASGSNEIPISTDAPTPDPINGIGDPDNDDMIGGGVGVGENPQAGSRNSASQTVLGAWFFYSAILLLCSSLVP